MWLVLALASALCAAMVAIWGKIGIQNIDPTLATMIRAAVFFVVLSIVALSLGRLPEITHIEGRTAKYILLSGVAGALSWLFYFWALKISTADRVVTIDRLSIVFVLILAALLLGEKLTVLKVVGGVLMVGGAILISLY